MDLQAAIDNFDRAMTHCDNIVAVHRAHGGGGGGRRYAEISLDRAVIVLAIAAWQAAVQDMTNATLDMAAPSSVPPIEHARYQASIGHVRKAAADFATPNAQNTRRLMHSAGFDPRPFWTWTTSGGRGRPQVTWTPQSVDARLDEWLKVRHAIAHGHDELPVVQALQSVRLDGAASDPSIRLVDAEQCIAFVSRLVRLTTLGLAAHLGVTVTNAR